MRDLEKTNPETRKTLLEKSLKTDLLLEKPVDVSPELLVLILILKNSED